jgi:hypothetical protein
MQPMLSPTREDEIITSQARLSAENYNEGRKRFEKITIQTAIEIAGSAVEYLREAKQNTEDTWEKDDDTYTFYLEMVGKKP